MGTSRPQINKIKKLKRLKKIYLTNKQILSKKVSKRKNEKMKTLITFLHIIKGILKNFVHRNFLLIFSIILKQMVKFGRDLLWVTFGKIKTFQCLVPIALKSSTNLTSLHCYLGNSVICEYQPLVPIIFGVADVG